MAGREAPINTGAAIHSDFSVPADCEGSQPQPGCATTSTRRDRSRLTTSAGSTCCDTASAGGDTLSATCTLPDTATLADQFNAAAKGFLNAVGASSGPLDATAFMSAAKMAGPRGAMPMPLSGRKIRSLGSMSVSLSLPMP